MRELQHPLPGKTPFTSSAKTTASATVDYCGEICAENARAKAIADLWFCGRPAIIADDCAEHDREPHIAGYCDNSLKEQAFGVQSRVQLVIAGTEYVSQQQRWA